MMKSFFKKLAFVMALAMVVTLAAPAAQASALNPLTIALQSATAKEEAFTEYKCEVGAADVDFKYYYAPKNYKELDPTWSSSDETVATVDKNGKITALKDGVTTIKIALSNGQEGSIELTVGKGNVPDVQAEQVSDTVVKLIFADKATDISDLVFYYLVGDTKIYYPCQVSSYKDGVATITSYVSFTDGWTYGFEVAGLEEEFTAVIGDVAAIVPTFKSEGKEGKAFATTETTVSYKLINAKGIDITNTAKLSGGTVDFSFVAESETGAFWFSNQEAGQIHFEEVGAAAQVVLKYYTGKYDEVTYEPIIGAVATMTIQSEKIPAFEIDKAVLPVANLEKNNAATDWAKATNIIALDDDGNGDSYQLVVKFASNKGDVTTKDTTYGIFSFKSTNEAKLYVAEDGTVMTNATGVTPVLVYFTAAGTNNKQAVGVVNVDVRAKRAVSTITPSTTSVTVSTKDENKYNEAEITFTLKDQLNADIAGTIEVEAKTKAPKFNKDTDCSVPVVTVEGNKVVITGNDANVPENAKSYTYTFAAKCGGKTANFSVTVRRPDSTISGYKIEFTDANDVKTTSNANLYATVTLYVMSNGVKNGILPMTNRPAKAAEAISGEYYYTVSKGTKDLGITGTATSLSIQLTNMTEVTGVASGSAISVVDKDMSGKGGAGSYTVVVYQAVGEAGKAASGFRQVATNTLTVKDSQDTMGTKATKVRNSVYATDVVEAVKNGFKFTYGNTTYEVKDDGTDVYAGNGVYVVPNANYMVDENGNLVSGSVCFVKTVDFYIPVGGSAYVKHTVTVNDYVEIK